MRFQQHSTAISVLHWAPWALWQTSLGSFAIRENREWNYLLTLVLPRWKPNFSLRLSSRHQVEGTISAASCGEHERVISLPLCFCLAALLSLLQSNLPCPGWTGQYNSHCPKSPQSWHLYFHWHTKILESTLTCWYHVSPQNLLDLILPSIKLGPLGDSRHPILGKMVCMTTAVRVES